METLWIIDLSGGGHSRLRECIAYLNKGNGNCWTYTPLELGPVNSVSDHKLACKKLLDMACRQVNDSFAGQQMNTGTFRICVLGDITSQSTRSMLPFVAVYLKRNWSRVLPNHPGIGVEIGTFFYVPSQMNLLDEKAQNEYAVFLESLNLLQERCMGFFYDFVIPFGDLQPVGKQAFPLLREEQLDELIFQFFLNCYWESLSPLSVLDNRGCTFGAMGALGYFYDGEYVKQRTASSLLCELLSLLRKRENEYDADSELADLLRKDREALLRNEGGDVLKNTEQAVKFMACKEIDVTEDLDKMEKSVGIHPVWHFYKSSLLPLYYLKELRYLPARLNEYLHFYKNALKKKLAANIREKRLELTANNRKAIDNLLETYWNSPNYQYKVLSQLEGILNSLIENRLILQKGQLATYCKDDALNPVRIPDFLRNEAEEIQITGTSSSFQKLLDNLKAILQKEPTLMGLLVRGVLVGTTGIFCLLPLLKLLSPHIINLGQTGRHELWWAAVIFVVPLLFLLGWRLRRHFKLIKRMKHKLWAYILLQLRNEMETELLTEADAYYGELIRYCKEKKETFECLRNALNISLSIECERFLTTFFNRPLDELISDNALLKEKVDIGESVEVDKMQEEQYYRLLKLCVMDMGYGMLDSLSVANQELDNHARTYATGLFNRILSRLVDPAEAKDLISAWLGSKDAVVQLGFCLDRSYPVGLFVDNTINSIQSSCRMNRLCQVSELSGKIRWQTDLGMADNLLFFTGFQQMDKLVLSRFLNNAGGGIRFQTTLALELACYYAYYLMDDRRGGCLGTTLVSSERLKVIDDELTKDE